MPSKSDRGRRNEEAVTDLTARGGFPGELACIDTCLSAVYAGIGCCD